MALGLSLLVLAALSVRAVPRARAAATSRPGESAAISGECVVDAPGALIEPGRVWCRGAAAVVSINTDTRNYIADVMWREPVLVASAIEDFRRLTDDVASTSQMNVRVTMRNNAGAILATCSRDLLHTAATCAAR